MVETETTEQLWHIFVGTYATSTEQGIYHISFDSNSGQIEIVNSISGIINPSYLTIDPDNYRLFAASETTDGSVVAFNLDKTTYKLMEINRQSTNGADPCYVSLDKTGKSLFFSNYSGGSFGFFSIKSDGSVGVLEDYIQLKGHSINPERQESPHPHTIVSSPKSSLQYIADLGTDKIFQYGVDAATKKLVLKSEVNTEPGAGPRHIAFHHSLPYIYVIQELNSSIAVYNSDEHGELTLQQTISTLPNDYTGTNITADIHVSPCGNYLYGSNRGHNSIVTYQIKTDGRLDLVDYTSTYGKTPRNFTIIPDGRHMLVANQDSNSIVVMKIDNDGVPKKVGIKDGIQNPVCLKVMPTR